MLQLPLRLLKFDFFSFADYLLMMMRILIFDYIVNIDHNDSALQIGFSEFTSPLIYAAVYTQSSSYPGSRNSGRGIWGI